MYTFCLLTILAFLSSFPSFYNSSPIPYLKPRAFAEGFHDAAAIADQASGAKSLINVGKAKPSTDEIVEVSPPTTLPLRPSHPSGHLPEPIPETIAPSKGFAPKTPISKFKEKVNRWTKALRNYVKSWIQSLTNRTKQTIAKWKSKLLKQSKVPSREANEAIHIQPKIAKPEPKLFEGRIIVPTTPPSDDELEAYWLVRDELAQTLYEEHILSSFLDHDKLTPESVTKIIESKLAPAGDPTKPEYQELLKQFPQQHQAYLTDLMNYQIAFNSIKPFTAKWNSIKNFRLRDLTEAESQVKTEIYNYLDRLDIKEFQNKFNNEYQKVVDNVISTIDKEETTDKEEIQRKMRNAFPPITTSYINTRFTHQFYQARAIQLGEQSTDLSESSFLSAEKIIQKLPKDLDLGEELYRYQMIQGFEKATSWHRTKVYDRLTLRVEEQLGSEFKFAHVLDTKLESLFTSTSKEDLEWRESLFAPFSGLELSPSQVWTKLQQAPEDLERINHALDSMADTLDRVFSEEEVQALHRASYSEGTFQKQLVRIENSVKQNEPKEDALQHLREITALSKLKRKTQISVNLPFVEELYARGRIDEVTREKLNLASKISPEKFKETLGTEEQFTKLLMDKCDQDLLKLVTGHDKDIEAISQETIDRTIYPYFEEIMKRARSIYLTPDAFTKPDSFRFVEALQVYDDKAVDEVAEQLKNPKQMFKYYVEAHLVKPKVQAYTPMDKFLSSIKIPQVKSKSKISNQLGIFSYFSDFDERLEAIFLRNLEVGDERLRGTIYANLSEESRQEINEIVNEIYSNREELDEYAVQVAKLSDRIDLQELILAPQFPELTKVLEPLLFVDIHPKT